MSQQTQARSRHIDQQSANLAYFLKYARTRPIPLAGTIPNAAVGGTPASNVAFSSEIPTVPAWATAIVIEATLPLAVTVAAGKDVNVSPYFPYSALTMSLSLAGSPPWDQISLVPWWLDEITSKRNFDPKMTGPGEANQQDPGAFAYSLGGFTPGANIHNGGGAPATTNGTVTFRVRCRLQRKPNLLFGAVPLGDPENRPRISMQLAALVGPDPTASPFQDVAAGGATAQLSAAGTVNVTFEGKSLDVLPKGIASIPTPIVGLGLAVNSVRDDIVSAGSIKKLPRNAAMLYEKVFHALINQATSVAGAPAGGQRADYFGKWLTGEQQSARWEYDASQGTFNDFYEKVLKTYGRYFPTGLYIDDMVAGLNPENPDPRAAGPYEAQMTPDTGYAEEFGLPATPAWNNALRIPTGTVINAAFCQTYEFGLVNVPY